MLKINTNLFTKIKILLPVAVLGFLSLVGTPVFAALSSVNTSSDLLRKEVALTFDDGPNGKHTLEILKILKKENVRATFFLIGRDVEKYPNIAKQIVENGNMVGNHTYDHPKNLPKLSPQQLNEELLKTDLAIASAAGIHTKLFRPPYGNITEDLKKELGVDGYKPMLWNVDPKDWDNKNSTDSIVQNVLSHLKKDMVIVFHDGRDGHIDYPRDNLIGALPTIIEDLKQRGYIFVTGDKISM